MASAPAQFHSKAAYRWSVASRAIAAIFGGYIFTLAASTFLMSLLPMLFGMTKAHATHAGLIFSFIFYMLVVLLVFAVPSAKRAWAWLLGLSLLFAGISFALRTGGLA